MKTMWKIDFEILRMKGFKAKFGVLKKNMSHGKILEKVLKFVSAEKGYIT